MNGLSGGRWTTVAGIRRWQPWTDEEHKERLDRLPAAIAEWRLQRVRALLREQYGDTGWSQAAQFGGRSNRPGREEVA